MKLNIFCTMMYLACFAGYVVPYVGIILPIIMWLVNKDQDASGIINQHGRNVLNFIISINICAIIAFFLCFIFCIGIPLLLAVFIVSLVVPVIAAVKAHEGHVWPIPFCIRFFK